MPNQEDFNRAHDIVINDDDFVENLSNIRKFYLAILANPNFSDMEILPEEIAQKALEHYENSDDAIIFAMVEKLVSERF